MLGGFPLKGLDEAGHDAINCQATAGVLLSIADSRSFSPAAVRPDATDLDVGGSGCSARVYKFMR